jgi:hypothetical protein
LGPSVRDGLDLWDANRPYWEAFTMLDAFRASVVSPDGRLVPQPLRIADVLAYGVAFGFCVTEDHASDYLTLIAKLDECAVSHSLDKLKKSPTAPEAPQ